MNKHDEYDVAEPTRRRLLKGVGALGGAFALAGGCPVAHAAKPQTAPAHSPRMRVWKRSRFMASTRRVF